MKILGFSLPFKYLKINFLITKKTKKYGCYSTI